MGGRAWAMVAAAIAVVVGVAVVAGRGDDRAKVTAASPGAAALSGAVTGDSAASSQVPNAGPVAHDPELRSRPGTVVARGDRYVIEDVALDQPATVEVAGLQQQVASVLRITITGGPFPVRDMPAIVSVDAAPVGVAIESTELSTLLCFTFDRSILREGAALAYAYGLPGGARTEWSAPIELTG